MPISTTGPDGRVFVPVIDTSAWQYPEYDSQRGVLGPGAVAPDLTAARDKGVAGVIHRVSNGLTAFRGRCRPPTDHLHRVVVVEP